MAMKCVAQMPYPIAPPAIPIHSQRVGVCAAIARWKILMATMLTEKQTTPASTTSRQSCSAVRQVRTRNTAVMAHVVASTINPHGSPYC